MADEPKQDKSNDPPNTTPSCNPALPPVARATKAYAILSAKQFERLFSKADK